jgi:hypothetical protein
MIVDKRGEENELKLQDLPLKILGEERKIVKSLYEICIFF